MSYKEGLLAWEDAVEAASWPRGLRWVWVSVDGCWLASSQASPTALCVTAQGWPPPGISADRELPAPPNMEAGLLGALLGILTVSRLQVEPVMVVLDQQKVKAGLGLGREGPEGVGGRGLPVCGCPQAGMG